MSYLVTYLQYIPSLPHSEKGRVPAWCDRVLWRTKTAFDVQLIDYISHPKMLISDHKPVSALFDVKVGTAIQWLYVLYVQVCLFVVDPSMKCVCLLLLIIQ